MDLIKKYYANPNIAKWATYHSQHRSGEGFLADIQDGVAYQHLMQTDNRFREEPRNLMFSMVTDGVQPWKENTYSIWPIVITPLNFPPSQRYTLGLTSLVTVVPGTRMAGDDMQRTTDGQQPKKKKRKGINLHSVMDILVDEFRVLDTKGISVWDSASRVFFTCYARTLQVGGH